MPNHSPGGAPRWSLVEANLLCPGSDGRRPWSQRLAEDDLDRGGGRAEDFEPHTMEQGPGAWEEARPGTKPANSRALPSPRAGWRWRHGGDQAERARPLPNRCAGLRAADSDPLGQAHRLAAPSDRGGRSLPPASARARRVRGWVRPPDSRWGAPLSTPLPALGLGDPTQHRPDGQGARVA